MPDWGYGSPSSLPGSPAATPRDWGFGSPSPLAPWPASDAESGYGSPTTILAPVVQAATIGYYPDDGGVAIVLLAQWADPGPYYVRLKAGNTFYPPTRNAYSGVPGQKDRCTPGPAGDSLSFVLPPAPPGTYDIRLLWGAQQQNEIIVPAALTIIHRMRSDTTYRLRLALPAILKAGPRMMTSEPAIVDDGKEWPHGHLRALTHAFGEVLRGVNGTPATRLTQPLAPGDTTAHVESTLELPIAGRVQIGAWTFRYALTTPTTLPSLVADRPRLVTIPTHTEVRLDARSIEPA